MRLNGRAVTDRAKGRPVRRADEVVVSPGYDRVRRRPDRPLAVLDQTAAWVAVDKPAGLAVHPLDASEPDTLLGRVAARDPAVAACGREGPLRGGTVHRLDLGTSGAVVFARNHAAWDGLRAAFAEHRVGKTYVALTAGDPPPAGRADLRLAVTRHRPARTSVVGPDDPRGQPTGLSWRTRGRRDGAAWLEVELETGFLHQIRAALAHLGFPLLGDGAYAPAAVAAGAPRPMLHARRLRLPELDGGAAFEKPAAAREVVCPFPDDLLGVWGGDAPPDADAAGGGVRD